MLTLNKKRVRIAHPAHISVLGLKKMRQPGSHLCYDDFTCKLESFNSKLRNLQDRVKVESDRNYRMVGRGRRSILSLFLLVLLSLSTPRITVAYRPGDIVPMSKMGLYHSMKTDWHDMIGRHCPIFAVNREVLIPIAKPTGYTGADPYKISFQVGREKFLIPWLYLINRKSSEVPMIDVHLRYSGSDLHGVTAKVVDMPHHYVEIHPDIRKQFWDSQNWPKHVLVRYTWEEQSEIDVTSGFFVLFGSGLTLSFILSIYILQSSRDKFARFVMERVSESSMPAGGVAKVE